MIPMKFWWPFYSRFASFYGTKSGWWLTYPSEKHEFVSWDDDILNIWKNKIHVPNHQPAKYVEF